MAYLDHCRLTTSDVYNTLALFRLKDFKKAAENVRKLAKTPPNEVFAKLYSLFKQATVGDCERDKPNITELKEKAKYEAWMSNKGMDREEAAKLYMEEAEKAVEKFGVKS
ncbi:hypothetical protein NP493_772g02002 [Ridgeia piscesae]|uniref:ACB domain-containing protein n=1 Tax=Ridgeia piscesae TaxID=27915 RepID=A0AAD9NPN9_RIDPI|nr:hypothetical protein NP493_772g02002 [Ridgeia piscesae]